MGSQTVLVVGGAGYIGSHTARLLFKQGYTPVILDDLSTGHREAARRATQDGLFYKGDYSDIKLVEKILKDHSVSAVMHFGAKALVGESVENPLLYYSANVTGTLNLLRAVLAAGVKNFIFSSSCAVFGTHDGSPIDEKADQKPINPYGRTKLMVEQILQDFEKAYGVRAGVLRYFNAAGADPAGDIGEDHNPETHLIPNALKAALKLTEGMVINGNDYATPDGTCVRDYIHINDLAAAHLRMLEFMSGNKKGLDVNLGVGHGYSILEIIREVEKVVGKKIQVRVGPRRPGDPSSLVANPSKAQDILNWKAQFDLNGIVESAYRWTVKHPMGYGA